MAQPPSSNQQIQPMAIFDAIDGLSSPGDAFLAIAQGKFPGVSHINKYGRNPDIDLATDPEDIWDGQGVYVPPIVAGRLHDLASDNVNDTLLGAGARVVTLEGLAPATLLWQTEDVDLDGATPVTTVLSWARIFRMKLKSAGSGLTNAGIITATAQTEGTPSAIIRTGNGKTKMAIYTVPAGKTAYMYPIYSIFNGPDIASSLCKMTLRSRGPIDVVTSPWLERHDWGLAMTGTSSFSYEFKPSKVFTEKTDIVVRCESVTQNNSDISAGFDLVLVDN